MASLNTIKNWFKTGLKPTQNQFWDTWDSFWHKDDLIPVDKIANLEGRFAEKADQEAFTAHLSNVSAHQALFQAKADKIHLHEIADVNELSVALDAKQEILVAGNGISIRDNVVSTTQQVVFGDFQIFKSAGNLNDRLEAGDIVRGFVDAFTFITGIYISGPTTELSSFTIIDQIDLYQPSS